MSMDIPVLLMSGSAIKGTPVRRAEALHACVKSSGRHGAVNGNDRL